MAERHQRNANDEASSSTLPGGRNVQSNISELTTQPSREEAIELHSLPRTPSHESLASISSDDFRIPPRRLSARSVREANREPEGPFRGPKKFWSKHVVLTVSQSQTLDHGGEFATPLLFTPIPASTPVFGFSIFFSTFFSFLRAQ